MNNYSGTNIWAKFLNATGVHIVEADGICWYESTKGLFPCYFPHQIPEISAKQALAAVEKAEHAWYARWQSYNVDNRDSPWWSVIKEGIWDVESVKDKKERWAVRQGRKRAFARRLEDEEVLKYAPAVVNKAQTRHTGTKQRPVTSENFKQKMASYDKAPGVLEYYGVFCGDKLVALAENHVIDNACLMCAMKLDPDYLKQYSSYCMLDAMLNDYLNERRLAYLWDGERNLYHQTGFQDFLMRSFGFVKRYSLLNTVYRKPLQIAINLAYPFRHSLDLLTRKFPEPRLCSIGAILKQESIVRSCRQYRNR